MNTPHRKQFESLNQSAEQRASKSRCYRLFTSLFTLAFTCSTLFVPLLHDHGNHQSDTDPQDLVATDIPAEYLADNHQCLNCSHNIANDSSLTNQGTPNQHQHPLPHNDCVVCLHLMMDMDSCESPSLLTGESPVEMIPVSEQPVVALVPQYSAPLRGPPTA